LKRAPLHEFTRNELRQLRALKTPAGVQRFLDSLPYHLADTAWSPRKVLQKKTAHCLEGAIFAAAALRVLGFPPLLWDPVAKSNFSGCRYREPVYRTLRELAMSYFNIYFNLRSERTLRRYSQPVDLTRFDEGHWMTSERSIWFIAEYLCTIPHTPLLTPAQARQLTRLDQRSRTAEMVGHRKKP
jgi:hypothetical protein